MGKEALKARWDRMARFHNLMEMPFLDPFRQMAWREANGTILELGVGTGANLRFHPPGNRVTAVDISPGMLTVADGYRKRLGTEVELLEMDIEELAFPSGCFDTVIATCVFCSVPDPVRGLREAGRVCKPGGRVILLEHIRSRHPITSGLMDALDPVVSGLLGSHINRDTVACIKQAGLRVESVRGLWSDILVLATAVPTAPNGV